MWLKTTQEIYLHAIIFLSYITLISGACVSNELSIPVLHNNLQLIFLDFPTLNFHIIRRNKMNKGSDTFSKTWNCWIRPIKREDYVLRWLLHHYLLQFSVKYKNGVWKTLNFSNWRPHFVWIDPKYIYIYIQNFYEVNLFWYPRPITQKPIHNVQRGHNLPCFDVFLSNTFSFSKYLNIFGHHREKNYRRY